MSGIDLRSARVAGSGKPAFTCRLVVSLEALSSVSAKLGVRIPDAYQAFLLDYGAGDMNDSLRFLAPDELYLFSNDSPMNGFLAIATDDLGNYLAFDPSLIGLSEESAVYYCCHDPFGHAKLAASFDDFIAQLTKLGFDYAALTNDPVDFQEFKSPQAKRAWWKFW
jgi:hypothetical protein